MKFYKCFRNDLRQGLVREWFYFVPILGIIVLFCINFYFRADQICMNVGEDAGRCFLDYIAFVFGGLREYTPTPDEPFLFPAVWIVAVGYASFLTLRYPFDNFESYGQQILLRTGKRSRWWWSKCLWVFVKTLLYYILVYGAILLFCILTGGELTGYPHALYLEQIFLIAQVDNYMQTGIGLVLFFLFFPFLLSLTLNYMQLFLNMIIGTVFSFFTTVVILITSSYYMKIVLIGNSGMLVRGSMVLGEGISEIGSLVIDLSLIIIFLFAGNYLFQRKDILKKEE